MCGGGGVLVVMSGRRMDGVMYGPLSVVYRHRVGRVICNPPPLMDTLLELIVSFFLAVLTTFGVSCYRHG